MAFPPENCLMTINNHRHLTNVLLFAEYKTVYKSTQSIYRAPLIIIPQTTSLDTSVLCALSKYSWVVRATTSIVKSECYLDKSLFRGYERWIGACCQLCQ